MSHTVPLYAAGTWTPTLLGSSSNPTVTYYYQTGTYVRVGRAVLVNARLQINTISGGSGDAQVGGFPYTATGADADRAIIPIGFSQGFTSTTTPSCLWMIMSTTTANVYRRASTDARDALNVSQAVSEVPAGALIEFSGMYFVG